MPTVRKSPRILASDKRKANSWTHIVAQSRRANARETSESRSDTTKVGYLFETRHVERLRCRITGSIGQTVDTDIGRFRYVEDEHPPFTGWAYIGRPPIDDQWTARTKTRDRSNWTHIKAQNQFARGGSPPPETPTVGYLFEYDSEAMKQFRITGKKGDRVDTDIGRFEYVEEHRFVGWKWYDVGASRPRGSNNTSEMSATTRSPVHRRSKSPPRCIQHATAKHASEMRKRPPCPANNQCRGERMMGNDERM